MGKWVWTTFNEYQWDLNWENPEVFLAILDTILFLANKGVEVFRHDAVAFMWKRMGTGCQNLPEVHDILQALTQATRVAASGDTRLMTHVLRHHFPESFQRACFATYIRCHDDIGWAITEEDAAHVPHMSGPGHRNFIADFYAGAFDDSPAHGADFQSNPATGDRRTNESFASLAGLEAALELGDRRATDTAIAHINLGHALIASFGGIPLIYMRDELGLMNDHTYLDDPASADDGRWMHRPVMDWNKAGDLDDQSAPPARIFDGLRHAVTVRKSTPQLASHIPTRIIETGNAGVFGYVRLGDYPAVTCLCNFTNQTQTVPVQMAETIDLLTGKTHNNAITLPPTAQSGCAAK